ncbi:MAG TPA: putative quinol monooxygenase [Acidimicrobiales bacterium]|nr:putative quinol monooxygenase [Acidimicrobiales bacterium]
MSRVAVHVKLPAAEGKGEELVAAFEEAYQPGGVDAEPGTLAYIIHQAADDPDTVVFYEMYADQAAFEAHSGGQVLANVMPKLAGLIAGAPEMLMLTVRNAYGVE